MLTKRAFISSAMPGFSKLSCAMTWHQWQAAYPTDSKIGLFPDFAPASVAWTQRCPWPGVSRCCSREGLVSRSRLLRVTAWPWGWRGSLGLEIGAEDAGLGAPEIERILGRVILRLPRAVGRDLVDVAEILGQAHPRVAQIVEEIRAQHVAAEAPAVLVAGFHHRLGAEADLVGRGHLEAGVVEARPAVGEQRHHVMVAAARQMQEGDDAGHAGGQLHAQHVAVVM